MSRALVSLTFFGIVAVALASSDPSKAEWTGKQWLGKWVSTDKQENWDAFVQALALPDQYSGLHKTIHTIWKEGPHFHHELSVPDKNYKTSVEFTIGQEAELTHNGQILKLIHSEDGNKLIVDVNIPARNKQIHDVYEVVGDELVKTYKTGDVVAKRWYKKEAL